MGQPWLDGRRRTVALVNLAAVMERLDEQTLPSLYSAVGASFQSSPTQLGYLTLCRALVQALASPWGGIAGHLHNRIWVITAGCLLWGVMTAGFATSTALWQGLFFWGVNGAGLALVIPSGQSLIADLHTPLQRGKAFGLLYLTSAGGGMLGSLFATNMGGVQLWGIEGWRIAFLMVALVSIVVGLLNSTLGVDPVKPQQREKLHLRGLLRQMGSFMRLPTFGIIVIQGIMGSVPWSALVYLTLYFQLLGMSNLQASILNSLFLAANALGALLGGFLGDRAASKYPQHGRILVCQFSVAVGIPFSLLLFKALPFSASGASVSLYALVLVTCGLLKCWAAPACNNPIFAEIVPPHMRNLVYAFDRCFEGALAALAVPFVGMLAEHSFGFKGKATVTGDPSIDLPKAQALGTSLLVFTLVPWTLCLILYSGLHYTYKRDCHSGSTGEAENLHSTRGDDLGHVPELQRLRTESRDR
ncbi:hypothetical protein WJX73_009675 [Symbiochloris irregularis]|uniref:Major facilitator superfamily (MFS) profile domain-containing protein n=1 Tax=Symbiochloris irregularis TaxID=706552 RepID=A0AAW1NT25_9CHLO